MLLDTSAWREYFIGSSKGARVKAILEKEDCYTSIVTLAEITNWALKNNKDTLYLINTVKELSNVIALDEDITVLAGRLNFERKKIIKKWGMLDSFVLASGTIYGFNILTKDSDFRDLQEVEIL